MGRCGVLVLMMLLASQALQAADIRRVEIRFEGGKPVTEETVRLVRGESVRIEWLSDRALELHLHGYDIEIALVPGERTVMVLDAFASGRFPLTSHGAGHDHRVLLYFEVHPE